MVMPMRFIVEDRCQTSRGPIFNLTTQGCRYTFHQGELSQHFERQGQRRVRTVPVDSALYQAAARAVDAFLVEQDTDLSP